MRKRATAIVAVFMSVGTAMAKHKKQEAPIPALVQAKVLGVHCDNGGDNYGADLVEPKVCQAIIDQLRGTMKYEIRNCPDVMDANRETHVTCLPKNDADLMLDVSEDTRYFDNIRVTGLSAELYSVSGHAACRPENPTANGCFIDNWAVSPGILDSPTDALGLTHHLVAGIVKLIDLRGGDNLQPYKAQIEKEYGIKR